MDPENVDVDVSSQSDLVWVSQTCPFSDGLGGPLRATAQG